MTWYFESLASGSYCLCFLIVQTNIQMKVIYTYNSPLPEEEVYNEGGN